jgi:hypothetical protein
MSCLTRWCNQYIYLTKWLSVAAVKRPCGNRLTQLYWKSCGHIHDVVGLGHSMTLVLVGSCEGET